MSRPFSRVVLLIAAIAACARARAEPEEATAEADAKAGAEANANANAGENAGAGSENAGEGTRTTAADVVLEGLPLYAFGVQAPILSQPEWPAKEPEKHGSVRLGYLRRGEQARAKGKPVVRPNCTEGWFELAGPTHGFVCGKYATLDAHHKELKFAPHAPYMDRNLPYEYGLNLTPGTPLYRRIPLKSERRENEKTLALGKGAKASDIAKKLKDNGEEVPAYLKDTTSAKPSVRFDDLKGDSELVAQRMLKGFYLSLDKKIDGRSGVFWHTMSGLLAPKDHLIVHEPKTEFDGVMLDAAGPAGQEPRKLPLAFVISTKAHATTLDGPEATTGDKIERFSIIAVTGKRQRIHDHVY